MYDFIGRLFPVSVRKNIGQLLMYSDIDIDTERYIGFTFLFDIALSIVITLFLGLFFKFNMLIVSLLFFVLFDMISYFTLHFKAQSKSKFIESILPDALRLTAGNLKAGITTDKALLLSARPEFGPFKKELIRAGKEIATGKEITKSLMDITQRVRSVKLKHVIELIVSGLKTGGQLSDLLQQTAEDLTRQKLIERKIRTNVKLYVIFISIAIAFASPVLYALSTFLLEVMAAKLAAIDPSVFSLIQFSTGKMLEISFVTRYIVISIATTVVLGSLVLGQISKGDEKQGIKKIPFLILISYVLFFVVLLFLRRIFGMFLI